MKKRKNQAKYKPQKFRQIQQSQELIRQTTKLNEIMKDFSDKSNEHNREIKKQEDALNYFTIVLIALTGLLLLSYIIFEHNKKTEEINKLVAEIDSLDLELQRALIEIDKGFFERREIIEKNITNFQFAIENVRANSFNGNIRNCEIKEKILIIYSLLLQNNQALKNTNSIEFIQLDEDSFEYRKEGATKEIFADLEHVKNEIIELRKLFSSYKICLIGERNFDKC